MGKTLSALVIMGVAVMMVFSLLPVFADGINTDAHGKCAGPHWNGPSGIDNLRNTLGNNPDPGLKDRNGNGHVCWVINMGNIQYRDDNPLTR